MKILYLTVEGQTEEAFAQDLLRPHLAKFNVFMMAPRLTGPHGRRGGRIPRGGMFNTFAHAQADMRRWTKENRLPDARFSMMVDLYSLPHDFPGQAVAMNCQDPYQRVEILESALAVEIADARFIPYLQVHEFEALILADPNCFSQLFENRHRAVRQLAEMCSSFQSPELINHGQHSHPKARIKSLFEDYDENVYGSLLAHAIGLEKIRASCPHFHQWLSFLEELDGPGDPTNTSSD